MGTKHLSADDLQWCVQQLGLREFSGCHFDSNEQEDWGLQEERQVDGVASIFEQSMRLPAGQRHKILRMLLTAATLASSSDK